MSTQYQLVVGLEIHAQLNTHAKIYCPDPIEFGGRPNTRTTPISLGHPGALPTLNTHCVELAIKLGLATHCGIAHQCHFARKNYFYADLPKGYQISQDTTPICTDGYLVIRPNDGEEKTIRIQRIHIEEDAGKSLHDIHPFESLIDLNRASVGLIEIVSHPDMRTPEEAMTYVTEIRKLVRYLDICDGNMEEGSLRCDANISVMPVGATEFGQRVEVKNINSISNIGRAIKYEMQRHIEVLEAGGRIQRETRTWDASQGRTLILREKETADDYRYFPEPDLQPLVVTQDLLQAIREQIPELPDELFLRLTQQLHLPTHDARLLTEHKPIANYYLQLLHLGLEPKVASNWVNGPVKTYLNEMALEMEAFPVTPAALAGLIRLAQDGQVSLSAARETLFQALVQQPHVPAHQLALQLNLILTTDTTVIEQEIDTLLAQNADKVEAYRQGKTGLLGFFVGQVARKFQGQADPKVISQLIESRLKA